MNQARVAVCRVSLAELLLLLTEIRALSDSDDEHPPCLVNTEGDWQIFTVWCTVSVACEQENPQNKQKFDLIKVNVLHADILHHGRLLVDVWSDDTKS